jgi:hypothetical protein
VGPTTQRIQTVSGRFSVQVESANGFAESVLTQSLLNRPLKNSNDGKLRIVSVQSSLTASGTVN